MHDIAVCPENEVTERRGKKVIVNGESIVLFRIEKSIYAIANTCPHQHFQLLHEGLFENGIVTCPMHGWSYDVKTGVSTNASGRVKTFPVEVINGKVFIKNAGHSEQH